MDEQLEKELRFHLDQHASDLIAQGCSPEEARRQARLAVGGPEQVKEECRDARGTRWLEDLWQDIRYALRTLRQRPGFSIVALLTLAIGIGATTAMFTVLYGVLLKPLSYPEPQRLVALHTHLEKFGDVWRFSILDFQDFKDQSRTLALGAWSFTGATISEPGEAEYVEAREVSAELFSVLGVPLSLGRSFLPSEDQRSGPLVAIISDSLWRRRYAASASVIGARLVYDGKPYTIVGVAPPGLRLDGEPDVLLPWRKMRTSAVEIALLEFYMLWDGCKPAPLWRERGPNRPSLPRISLASIRNPMLGSTCFPTLCNRNWRETLVPLFGSCWVPSPSYC